jgi:acetyl esterase/lipase
MKRFLIACCALIGVSGCSGIGVLNAVAVKTGPIERDVAYGDLPRQKLDVYSPKTMTDQTPVLVFYHGGSWQYGTKDEYRFLGDALSDAGIQTVVVNYRLYPEVIFPAFVEDAAKALAYTKAKIAGERPVFIAGHSAGAHIAAMVALDPRFLSAESSSICATTKGVIGLAGPYDFTPVEPQFKAIFPAEILPSTKPINFTTSTAPPFLLLHGAKDNTVPLARSIDLAKALRAHGNQAVVMEYQGVDHNYIVGALSPLIRKSAPTLRDITNFIAEQKAQGYTGCGPR